MSADVSADPLDRVASLLSAAATTTSDVRLAYLALARSTLSGVEERAKSLAMLLDAQESDVTRGNR